MADIKLLLFAYVAFLLPVAAYCLILATVNRRINPVMVSGTWDSIGLLFATAGILLVCGPSIIYINFDRHGVNFLAEEHHEDPAPARLLQNQAQSSHLVVIIRPEVALVRKEVHEQFRK